MSMYGMLFGRNPMSSLILATLDLTPAMVGRFRDCFVSDGEIAVYTRNGGGNRGCWHDDSPEWGSAECKHRLFRRMADVYAFMPQSEWPNGKAPGNIFTSKDGVSGCEYRTGEQREEDAYHCLAPDSFDCACVGCTIQYRLPAHPLYLRDEDDDFDSTYATIYFRIPEKHAELLRALESGKFDPDQRWNAMLDGIKDGARPEVAEALRPFFEAVVKAATEPAPQP